MASGGMTRLMTAIMNLPRRSLLDQGH